jgi:hypothetical protein
LSCCAINLPCAAASATTALEPSLIALVNVSTPLAALVNLTTLNHQILFLQLFQLLLKLVQGPNKTHLNIHLMV